jgi:hypothetical protein
LGASLAVILSKGIMDHQTTDNEILEHYHKLWGPPSRKFPFSHSLEEAPSPLFIYEFAGNASDTTFVYATLGASHKAMKNRGSEGEVIMEVFILCNQQQDELVDSLGEIAIYPFIHETYFAEGHTVHGSEGFGIVNGSPLTDLLITRADYGEIPDYIVHRDKRHTHLFWVVPIYPSEREFAVANGWRKLQELFDQKQIDVLNFWRTASV